MLTKVPDSLMEKIDFGNETIILNGAPTQLYGTVRLHNQNETKTRIRYLDLKSSNSKSAKSLNDIPLYINSKLQAGETRLESLSLSLAPETPPGTYEQYLEIGGRKQKVQLIVQPTVSVALQPNKFTLQGTSPGTKHTVCFTVTNLGNLDFQIPEVKHVAALDMDMLCRAFGVGFREDITEGFNATLDQVTQNLKEHLPNWANAEVAEAGEIIKPGKEKLVNVSFIMPNKVNANNDYDLNVRFWDQALSFTIKSHQEPKRTGIDGK